MKKYRVCVEQTRVTYFDLYENEIAEGDDENIAAAEIADSLPESAWDVLENWVDVEEVDDEL